MRVSASASVWTPAVQQLLPAVGAFSGSTVPNHILKGSWRSRSGTFLRLFFRNQKYPLGLTTAVPGGLTETQCIVVFLYHVQMRMSTTRKLRLGWMLAELILLLGGKMKPV